MIYKIITPNPEFTGDRAGVQIVCGHGVTRDPAIAAECKAMGYIVVEKEETLPLPFLDPAPAAPADPPIDVTLNKPVRRRAPKVP